MIKKIIFLTIVILLVFFAGVSLHSKIAQKNIPEVVQNIVQPIPNNPLQISYLRKRTYPGSDLKIEETLSEGSNYKRYIASYISEGLKIYGLLTIPNGNIPPEGFPAIIFNHGYITPQLYTPDGNYIAYVNALASSGYILFKPDYRGHWKSEGMPTSAYFSTDYDIDDLNAITSIKRFNKVNPNRVGIWGHSMGGHITLVDLVVSKELKAAVIWGGVVGSYSDIIYNWQNRVSYQPDAEDLHLRNLAREDLLNKYGTPGQNPDFWNSIDPVSNLNLVDTPVQIHVGLADNEVPEAFSENLYAKLKSLGKNAEFYTYSGADHNISQSFGLAMARSIAFFDKYLK